MFQKYLKFNYLWDEFRDDKIEEFCDTNPLIVEISEKFQEYDSRAEYIKQLPEKHNVGAIKIMMGVNGTFF